MKIRCVFLNSNEKSRWIVNKNQNFREIELTLKKAYHIIGLIGERLVNGLVYLLVAKRSRTGPQEVLQVKLFLHYC